MQNIGLDFGNSHTKAKAGKQEIIFESGFKSYPLTTGEEQEMKCDDLFYVFNKRDAVEQDKTKSNRMMLCTLYAVAQILDARNADPKKVHHINLGVDIPIDLFGKMKNRYIEYYKGKEKEISYKGNEYKIVFDEVKAYPQGVVVWAALQGEITEKQIVLVDIGGRTIDIATIVYDRFSGKLEYRNKLSLQHGVLTLINRIDQLLQTQGIQLDEKLIQSSVYGDTINHMKSDEIKDIVEMAADEYVEEIMNLLYENNIDAFLPVILIGGGGDMMYSRLVHKLNIIKNTGNLANAAACLEALESSM